jgi:hypothetical protein
MDLQIGSGDITAVRNITTTGDITINGTNNTVAITLPPTTGAAANVNWNSVNGNLRVVTSLSKFKIDQQPIDLESVQGLLKITPKTYLDKTEYNENGQSKRGLTRYPGFIAEDMLEHAPLFAVHNHNGELRSVAYDRISAGLLVIVKDQQQRIEELERKIQDLS